MNPSISRKRTVNPPSGGVAKNNRPLAQPDPNYQALFDTEPPPIPAEEEPLDLLCDLAWRLATSHSFVETIEEWDYSPTTTQWSTVWDKAVQEAGRMIHRARAHNMHRAKSSANFWRWIDKTRNGLATLRKENKLTQAEEVMGRVSFRRGCKLITALSDGPDAEKRFLHAMQIRSFASMGVGTDTEYKSKGFRLRDVVTFSDAYKNLPRSALRKPYEKSGRYRRNKQGRKKNPKK